LLFADIELDTESGVAVDEATNCGMTSGYENDIRVGTTPFNSV